MRLLARLWSIVAGRGVTIDGIDLADQIGGCLVDHVSRWHRALCLFSSSAVAGDRLSHDGRRGGIIRNDLLTRLYVERSVIWPCRRSRRTTAGSHLLSSRLRGRQSADCVGPGSAVPVRGKALCRRLGGGNFALNLRAGGQRRAATSPRHLAGARGLGSVGFTRIRRIGRSDPRQILRLACDICRACRVQLGTRPGEPPGLAP